MLDKNKKSVIVRWHNAGRTLEDIVARFDEPRAEVEAFLMARPGYPDTIVSPTAKYEKKRRPGQARDRSDRSSENKGKGTGVYAGNRNEPGEDAEPKKRGPSGPRPVTLVRITLLEEKSVLER